MFYNMRNTYVLTMNLASNAPVSSSIECIDPSSRLSNHLMATEPRLEGKTLHIRALFLEWMVFFFFLIKMDYMFDMIGLTIINGKSGLIEMIWELGLLNTLTKRGAGYLGETLSHGNMPLASWWGSSPSTIMCSSRSVMG